MASPLALTFIATFTKRRAGIRPASARRAAVSRVAACRGPLAVAVLLLAACTSTSQQVTVVDASDRRIPATYVVRPGDTLYAIAWRFGLDYRTLARANKIKPPYTIYVNQRLRMVARAAAKEDGPPPNTRLAVIPSSRATAGASAQPRQTASIRWHWPLEGPVLTHFKGPNSAHKGIELGGRAGQSVASAADGVVVYAGGGLRGYGRLVIVKHDDTYLSAYGRNRRLVVNEGQRVKAGQKLAEAGPGDADRPALYFEIRKDGTPQDPLRHLPRRRTDR